MQQFWRRGEPYVWATGAALSMVLAMTGLLLYVVLANSLPVFWPATVTEYQLEDGGKLLGETVQETEDPLTGDRQLQLKIGNRDLYGLDFRWVDAGGITDRSRPPAAVVLERMEYGNFYGFLREVAAPDLALTGAADQWPTLEAALARVDEHQAEIARLEDGIASLNNRMEKTNNKLAGLAYGNIPADDPRVVRLEADKLRIRAQFAGLVETLANARTELRRNVAIFTDAAGTEREVVLADIVRAYRPNEMSLGAKIRHYLSKIKELLTEEPRESNTEGGLFPAIFGTVLMVFLMSILSFPLGVIAGIYLREYAREGILVRLVRIAVNNLAGIPSIVYGIFGLGFFVYGLGAQIDQLFFPERLPTPTYGTGGILWASITLGLLTVPVVIVSTEEALGAIPTNIRDGSLALGATKFQTLARLLLPMASPGIMTGFILAMARAAGEVAPLMITGVVKLAPALPIDSNFPFFHLDRKFMHLGFHIYDIGFQSPNVEAAKPMVYVTTLLLLLIVVLLSSTAIYLRNKMRKRYAMKSV